MDRNKPVLLTPKSRCRKNGANEWGTGQIIIIDAVVFLCLELRPYSYLMNS
jgi:hypothetical protein